MKNLEIIEKYIVYLISECGLSVTLHPMEKDNLITFSRLMRFNTHDNMYCAQVKSTKCGHERCLAQQRRVYDKMCGDGESFSGVCHAGVFEYVYPLRNADEVIGFISVGGYSCKTAEARIARTSEELAYPIKTLQKAYLELKSTARNKEYVDTLIYPLCHMLELSYRKEAQMNECDTLTRRIIRYVQQNYNTGLSVDEICKQFGCSRSYFSHTFKRETGEGFREYLINIRIGNAKRLLALSSLNVTEVAFAVGFSDSNYFNNLFKKKTGVTPLAYRRSRK